MSYQQFARKYGASPADVQRVINFARANKLQVVEASAPKRMVILSGPLGTFCRLFSAKVDIYENRETGETYRGRKGKLYVPNQIRDAVTVITGLDNRPQVKRFKQKLPPVDKILKAGANAAIKPEVHSPPEVAQLYNFPSGLDGSGQCIGLFEFAGGFTRSDLKQYFSEIGVKLPKVTAFSVDGTMNRPGSDADGEVMLDIEVAGAIAPGAHIVVYFAQFTEAGWTEAITKAVHDTKNRPSVISISWGFAEEEDAGGFAFTPQVMDDINLTLNEAAQFGVTVLVAAGDDGSIDGITQDGRAHVDFPASSPFALAVGGTTVQSNQGQIVSEVVWSNGIRTPGTVDGSTGGGVSEHFQVPQYQASSTAKLPKSINTGFAGRAVPDVSAMADFRTAYKYRVDGVDGANGGTSAATPLWAALIALINQQLANKGVQPVGFFNPLLYNTVGTSGAFNDIISGSNDALGTLNGAYEAGQGWDACSGWGSPNGAQLLAALT
jgi:kumamolisin